MRTVTIVVAVWIGLNIAFVILLEIRARRLARDRKQILLITEQGAKLCPKPDPVQVEELAFTLYRMDIATSGLDGDEFPLWHELDPATRRHYRAAAEYRILSEEIR